MNHDPNKIMAGMAEKNRMLTMKNDEYVVQSERYAEAKRNYHMAYATKILELKAEGNPITIIKEIVNGDKHVAELRYQMDVSEGIMRANKESMADTRSALDSYRSILTWLRTELQNANIPQTQTNNPKRQS